MLCSSNSVMYMFLVGRQSSSTKLTLRKVGRVFWEERGYFFFFCYIYSYNFLKEKYLTLTGSKLRFLYINFSQICAQVPKQICESSTNLKMVYIVLCVRSFSII